MPKITKLFVQGLGGGYRHLSNPTWKLLSSHSWLSLMVKLCLQGSGVKMTNQQLVAVGNLFAPGAGKTDSPLTSPWLSSSTSSSSSSLSTITKDAIPWAFNHYPNWRGRGCSLNCCGIINDVHIIHIYHQFFVFTQYYMAQKKQHFVHAKSGKSCPHCLPYTISKSSLSFSLSSSFS